MKLSNFSLSGLTGSCIATLLISLLTLQPARSQSTFALGADVSWLTEMEASGRFFYNREGQQKECMSLLRDLGMNSIRLRVWVNPAGGWNGINDVLVKARRAHNLGMRLMIAFHYSDDWADPGKQKKPAAWANLSFSDLRKAVYNHTYEVLDSLKKNGITPEWVQVGNETGNGMLWEDGRASTSMSNFAQLCNSGYDAVKALFPSTKVIIHLHNGYDNGLYRWMFDGLKNNGAKYDMIGMSLYPSWSPDNWKTTVDKCKANMMDMVQRYNKEVMIVETGISWDSPDAFSFLSYLIQETRSVGKGVLYWEPQSYRQWRGYTLGAFDNSGRPTKALDAFGTTSSLEEVNNIKITFDYRSKTFSLSETVERLKIYSTAGRVEKTATHVNSILVDTLPSGVYILEYQSETATPSGLKRQVWLL